MRHSKEVREFLESGDFVATDEGLLIHGGIKATGRYYHTVNGQDERVDSNLIVGEGILYLLEAGLGTNTFDAAHYLALYVGNATPAANWTAANFTANSTESTNDADGYSETVRQTWTPAAAAAGVIGNLASRASFTIATGTTVTVYGAGLLSSSVKGGTTGVLVSSSRFDAARVLNDTDTFELGYEVELTDS
jgi:hypothetical protein